MGEAVPHPALGHLGVFVFEVFANAKSGDRGGEGQLAEGVEGLSLSLLVEFIGESVVLRALFECMGGMHLDQQGQIVVGEMVVLGHGPQSMVSHCLRELGWQNDAQIVPSECLFQ